MHIVNQYQDTPLTYHLRVEGHIDPQWGEWFGGVTVTQEANGKTLLTCEVPDQPALYGLLRQIRDLGVTLISVNQVVSNDSTLMFEGEPKMTMNPAMSNPVVATTATERPAAPQLLARLSGVLYLIITVAAVVAHFNMPGALIVADDPAATVANIGAAENYFRLGGIGAELVILLSEAVLSVLLYVLLKPVNKTVAILAAVGRLLMTAVHGLNLLNYGFVLMLIGSPAVAGAFTPEQVQALVSVFLDAHGLGFTLGIAFLVIHMFALGTLIFQSGYFPRFIGVLFLVAGLGYMVDVTALLFIDGYTTGDLMAMAISLPEIAFPLWLLVRGVNRNRWAQS